MHKVRDGRVEQAKSNSSFSFLDTTIRLLLAVVHTDGKYGVQSAPISPCMRGSTELCLLLFLTYVRTRNLRLPRQPDTKSNGVRGDDLQLSLELKQPANRPSGDGAVGHRQDSRELPLLSLL